MMKCADFLLLYTNIKVVKGYTKATICDLQRNQVVSIPNTLADFILGLEERIPFQQYVSRYSQEEQIIISDYVEFLESNEFVFWTDSPKSFPELDLVWKAPETINNAIIEIEELSNETLISIANSLTNLGCKHLEIRFYRRSDFEKLEIFLDSIQDSFVRSIIVYSAYDSRMDFIKLESLIQKNSRLTLFVLHSCELSESEVPFQSDCLKVIKRNIDSAIHCGVIEKEYFTSRIQTYTEMLTYNGCLNRKVAICTDGSIKNCPSMTEDFGSIYNIKLEEAISTQAFRLKWQIHKDTIDICRDCEYRRVCTDCRAYLLNPSDMHSKPLKCGYDPYSGKWQDWRLMPLAKTAVSHYISLNQNYEN